MTPDERTSAMQPHHRIVTKIPLEELWTAAGTTDARRLRPLSREPIRDLLRRGPVRFVVANVGLPLRWIEGKATFDFWKGDAGLRIADPAGFSPDDFPERYAYLASEWHESGGTPIVLLETVH